jgi:hypothetical protein
VSGAYTVQPETPGQWSEADEFRAQHARRQMQADASALAGTIMLGSVPRAVARGAADPNVLCAGVPPLLPMDFAARMARARALGFNTEMRLYHGTNKAFSDYKSRGGRVGDILVVKEVSQLRSPQARFDPARLHSRNLLAGGVGLGLFAPLAFPLARTEQQSERLKQ